MSVPRRHAYSMLLSIALLVFVKASCAEAQHFPDQDGLLKLIRARVDAGLATGIVVGVIEADGTRKIAAYGNAGAGASPLSATSVFEIGSITKVFTGILLADMVARGELSLDDPAQKHAGEGMRIPGRAEKQITLVDLATHHSGLPPMPSNFAPADRANPYADYGPDRLRDFLNGHELTRDIGAGFQYSNLGVGLLGNLLATRAKTDYPALVQQRILAPLDMSMTAVRYTPQMTTHRTVGHDITGTPVPGWDITGLAGAGALRSNVNDMLTFIDANIGAPRTDLERAMRASHEPRREAGPDMRVGLNWMIRIVGDDRIVWHNGGTGGYRTFIGFDPVRNVGAVVLTNSTHGADDIGFHLINNSVVLRPPTVPNSGRQAITVAPEVLRRYVGTYELTPQFRIEISVADGRIYLQATNQSRIEMSAESETRFFLRVVEAQITFVIEDGAVAALILHQGGRDQRARKLN